MHGDGTSDRIGAPVPAAAPPKRRAFLGRFAPAFYDMANHHQVYGQAAPNAVLENAIGLMLCYDELWFLRREDCPADMQALDFVRFVSDDADLQRTAKDAFEAGYEAVMADGYEGVRRALPGFDFEQLPPSPLWFLRKRHIATAMSRAGYVTDLVRGDPYREYTVRPVLEEIFDVLAREDVCQMAEWLVADSLQLGPMDVIVNTEATFRWSWSPRRSTTERWASAPQFERHMVEALEQIVHLRSTDALTPAGAYQEYIAELRKDKRVKDLRTFLAGKPSPRGSAATLATEVEELIREYQDEAFRQRHRPALLRTIGSMAISTTGNQLLPGLGSFLGALVNADRVVSDSRFKKNTRWAMFVLDARDKQQPSSRPARGGS